MRPVRSALLAALLTLLCRGGGGLPSGAPDAACLSLRPAHGSHGPQTGPPPYQLHWRPELSQLELRADQPFRGLLLQARSAANSSRAPLGRFLPADGLQLLHCGGQQQSALTHTSTSEKQSLEVSWEPHDVREAVVFTATVLADYRTWWEDVRSDSVPPPAGAAPLQTAPLQQLPSGAESTYAGCFEQYGCFGSPAGCEADRACDVLFTYKASAGGVAMGLMAKQDGHYAAVGLSEDAVMGDDGVIFCTNDESSLPKVYYGVNPGRYSTYKTGPEPDGVSDIEVWEQDGYFKCSFTQALSLVIPDSDDIDLTKKHHLLVATGVVESSGVGYHHEKKIASSEAVDLTDNSALKSAGIPPLIKAHGIFMLMAWVGTAGIGILSAQYFRSTWVGKKVLGTDVWFTLHRSMMAITALFTWIGFTLIVIQQKKLSFDHNHNIVGFTVFLLTILQVVGGMLRPSPDARWRPLFTWPHRVSGAAAYILAMTALLLAQQLPQTMLPRYWLWIVIGAACLHVMISLSLLVNNFCGSAAPKVEPDTAHPCRQDGQGSCRRKVAGKVVLCIYSLQSVALVITLLVTLLTSG